ncbi:MAG: hypothetical protein H0V76_10775 [Blastocatellia bacterium]|nr:hypothetical protein [Blastocatellia bacterium]
MRTLFALLVLFSVGVFLLHDSSETVLAQNLRYMVVCNDGDGDLSGWLSTREEAYIVLREHERNARGHKSDIVTRGNPTPGADTDTASCSIVEPGRREGVIRVENTCGECRSFRMQRVAEGETIERIIQFEPGKPRHFRTRGGTVSVLDETGCD